MPADPDRDPEATLNLIGPDSSLGSPVSHQATATFVVHDAPWEGPDPDPVPGRVDGRGYLRAM